MTFNRALKISLLGCLCSVGALAGGYEFAAAQNVNVATVTPNALRDLCLKGSDSDPSRTEISCTDALTSGVLDDRAAASAHNRRAQAFVDLGHREKAMGDFDDALRLLDKLIDPDVAAPADLFQRALALQGLGRLERAMSDYSTVILRAPTEAPAFVARGVLLSENAKYSQAIADFDSALRLQPENAFALMQRGNAYSKTGEYARALADLNKAIALSPANAEAYVFRGVSYGHQGKNQRALADYNTALSINPRAADALTSRAAIYENSGKNAEAIKDLTTAIDLLDNDNDALAHYNRGVAYFALNQYERALEDYTVAVSLDGRMDFAYSNRCLTQIVMGRDARKALQDCDKAVELNPNAVDVYNVRGFVKLKLGQFGEALDDYNSALKLDQNSPHALYGRGLAKIKHGEPDGEADRNAARAARPNIDQSFAFFGVL